MAQYQLFYVNEKDSWEALLSACNVVVNDELAENKVIYNLLNYLKKYTDLGTVVIENDYIDADYRNEYSYFYSKTFKKHASFCKRLHFFEGKINNIEELDTEEEVYTYLGFMILRPLNFGKVGRTVITPQNKIFCSDKDYILCKEAFHSHMFGRTFEVVGSPFIEQDSMVITCAQASIWMCARYMHKKLGYQFHLPYNITKNASSSLGWAGRVFPSDGLTVYMMLNALNKMGYSPIFHIKPSESEYQGLNNAAQRIKQEMVHWDKVSGHIYKYVESKIPVIVLMPDHAITVVGHTFNPDSKKAKERIKEITKNQKEDEVAIISSFNWIDGFIINDDRSGPYKILPVDSDRIKDLTKRKLNAFYSENDIYETCDDKEGIIVPLPEKVYLLGQNIDPIIKRILNELVYLKKVETAQDKGCTFSGEFLDALEPSNGNPVTIRSFFMRSTKYKERLNKRVARLPKSERMIDSIRKKYMAMKMPKFIWVTELTTAKRFSMKKEDDRTILGEIILDTTVNKRNPFPFLSIHLPGVLICKDPDTGSLREELYFPTDKPYRIISRHEL